MPLRNKRGTPIDPVPFLVVAALGVATAYSYGPIYLMELGFDLAVALGISTASAAVVTGAAYYRFVWTVRPELQREVPGPVRFRRLVYGVAVLIALIVLLSLPLFV